MAEDRRTRRMSEAAAQVQRTLDPSAPAPERPMEMDPPDLLETLPPRRAGTALEERQKRWFQLRERVLESEEKPVSSMDRTNKDPTSEPKD